MSRRQIHVRLNEKDYERLELVARSIDSSIAGAVKYLIRFEKNSDQNDTRMVRDTASP